MPKVSVVIPVYGVEKYIERCARSLFEQTLDDIEYIFVNDCTKDRSIDILNEVINDYPVRKQQVRIVHHEENKGSALARLSGWQTANGDYIISCDSDDWVDLNLYESMYNVAVEKDADIVVSDYMFVEGGDANKICGLRDEKASKEQVINDLMYMRTSWSLWNKLIRNDLFGHINEFPQKYMGDDMGVVLPLFDIANVIAYCPNACYNYDVRMSTPSHQTTLNATIRNYNEVVGNLAIVSRYYNKYTKCTYRRPLYFLLFNFKLWLLPYINNKEAAQLFHKNLITVLFYVITNREIKKYMRKDAFKLLMKRLLGLI